jgi:Glycosyl transferase family 2
MSSVQKVIWGCIVHKPDAHNLSHHLRTVALLTKQPDKIIVVDNDGCDEIKSIVHSVSSTGPIRCEYIDGHPNRGFNAGFNTLLRMAVETNDFEYLASMSVRAQPETQWLSSAMDVLCGSEGAGAAATVQLDKKDDNVIYGIGHYYRDNGGLYCFGYGVRLSGLKQWYQHNPGKFVWSPCSGAALYRTEALQALASSELWLDPFEFKSYNCNVLGFLLAEQRWTIALAWDAISIKDLESSTSVFPSTEALRINQELCRIEQLHVLWPDPERERAIQKYLFESSKSEAVSFLIVE